jgi:tRNA threonylcarbamoyladenosine dehydratase
MHSSKPKIVIQHPAVLVQVTVSSLNRHAVATRADVGLPKAAILAEHFERIFPEASVEARVAMFSQETEESILGADPKPDMVLDAIDNLETKVRISIKASAFRN